MEVGLSCQCSVAFAIDNKPCTEVVTDHSEFKSNDLASVASKPAPVAFECSGVAEKPGRAIEFSLYCH